MAATEELKQEFIELRAKSYSFDKIAEKIGVSKTTLIKWSKHLRYDIQNLKEIEEEATLKQYAAGKKHRLEILDQQLAAIRKELSKRDYSDFETKELLDLALTLQSDITKLRSSVSLSADGGGSLDLDFAATWVV